MNNGTIRRHTWLYEHNLNSKYLYNVKIKKTHIIKEAYHATDYQF